MKKAKQSKLQSTRWKVGKTGEFLGLSPDEEALVDIKLVLADSLREVRKELKLTQSQVARRLHSSQSRVAKMEVADPSVSVDLLIRSLLAMGKTRQDLGDLLAS